MRTLAELVRKEFRLLGRDWHALALLFVMPTFFILVMSLALRDLFSTDRRSPVMYQFINRDTMSQSGAGAALAESLARKRGLRNLGGGDLPVLLEAAKRDQVRFVVVVPDGFGARLRTSDHLPVEVYVGPGVDGATSQIFLASLNEALSRVVVGRVLDGLSPALSVIAPGGAKALMPSQETMATLIVERPLYSDANGRRPTSVQQIVPSWLVFAMFFVSLPLSTTWLEERRQGMEARLRAVGITPWLLIAGKAIPYILINLVQVVLMLAVGIWIVPRVGGDALSAGQSWPGLALIALAVSVAAVSFGLLVANLSRTAAQATILTGVSNLVFGAIGGVMVPRAVMAESMQRLSITSPMAWGLEGFLDILLRGGGVATVLPRVVPLFLFGGLALTVAAMRMTRVHAYEE